MRIHVAGNIETVKPGNVYRCLTFH